MFIFKILSALMWNLVIFGGLLFLPAGTLNWWRGWVFLGVVVVGTVATMIGVFRFHLLAQPNAIASALGLVVYFIGW